MCLRIPENKFHKLKININMNHMHLALHGKSKIERTSKDHHAILYENAHWQENTQNLKQKKHKDKNSFVNNRNSFKLSETEFKT
jgi:hypothetical protein